MVGLHGYWNTMNDQIIIVFRITFLIGALPQTLVTFLS